MRQIVASAVCFAFWLTLAVDAVRATAAPPSQYGSGAVARSASIFAAPAQAQ